MTGHWVHVSVSDVDMRVGESVRQPGASSDSPGGHGPVHTPEVSLVSPPVPQAPGLASASKHRASWKEAKPRAEAGPVPCSWALPGYWGDPDKEEKFRRVADPELEEPRNGEEKLADPAVPAQSLALASWA